MHVSSPAALDEAVAAVAARRPVWPKVATDERVRLLRRCVDGFVAIADDMASAGCRAKGLDPASPAGAEEWLSGPVPIIRNLRLLANSLQDIAQHGHPRVGSVRPSPNGGCRVNVFPDDGFDRVLYAGVGIDVWLDAPTPVFLPPVPDGGVALVLSAGNVSSIGPMDVLYKLFVENRVCVVKLHPINDYLGEYLERAFAPLIDGGFVRIVHGGAEEGQRLIAHPLVDTIHITGSAAVHDRIAASTPKPITSELGCVTPVIVLPGEWSEREIAYQAENVATMVALNASCNCNAAKVIVTWCAWPQRRAFLDRVGGLLRGLPARCAYYPGSVEKYERFVAGRGLDSPLDASAGALRRLPFVTLFDVDPARTDALVFTEEAWSPIIAETALAADDPAGFLDTAVRFCNDHVEGTLSAVVLADPRQRARLGGRFDRAIADLRYGTVAINHWSAVNYALAVAPWGAYPRPGRRSPGEGDHTRESAGSGIGVVHNTKMLDRVVKTVVDAPFTTWPKPAWFCTHSRSHLVARQMVHFEAHPSLWRVPAIALNAALG